MEYVVFIGHLFYLHSVCQSEPVSNWYSFVSSPRNSALIFQQQPQTIKVIKNNLADKLLMPMKTILFAIVFSRFSFVLFLENAAMGTCYNLTV